MIKFKNINSKFKKKNLKKNVKQTNRIYKNISIRKMYNY